MVVYTKIAHEVLLLQGIFIVCHGSEGIICPAMLVYPVILWYIDYFDRNNGQWGKQKGVYGMLRVDMLVRSIFFIFPMGCGDEQVRFTKTSGPTQS